MDKRLERILPRVQKPARYTGGEYNAVKKDPAQVDTRIAFCFPDTYEIGMSNLGMRILYGVMNNMDGVWCQRVFAPWGDMEEEMRKAQIPLFALESGEAITNFDIVAFSVGYEMAFSSLLNMLDLAGIPLHSADRTGLTPLVVAGGTAMYNPEPIADFVDIVSLGEGEDVTVELIELHRKARREGWSKEEFLRRAAQIPGLYVPSLYTVAYNPDGTVKEIVPRDGAPRVVRKRIVEDMDKSYYPAKTIVPSTEIVQDRVTLELFRGCIRGCRFCQAGYVYRPVRNRSKDLCVRYGEEACNDSGYQEVTLSSLSTSDYPQLTELCDDLEEFCRARHVNLSLPSLRADNFSMSLMQRLAKGRKSGLTFAPEAGSQRLRDVINKGLTEEVILHGAGEAFKGGWNQVKLYFMLGLPTETEDDMKGIAHLAQKIAETYYEVVPKEQRKGKVQINVSTSFFVPKPFTPFQWAPMYTEQDFVEKAKVVKNEVRAQLNQRSIRYNWHEPDVTALEGFLARGDRRCADVILKAYEKGALYDAWTENFDYDIWKDAMAECGVDMTFYTLRERSLDEILPWDFIDTGVSRRFLEREWQRAKEGVVTENCRQKCSACGAMKFKGGVCLEGKN